MDFHQLHQSSKTTNQTNNRNTDEETKDVSTKFDGELVDLIVGKEAQRFQVHKTVLCNRIPYFNKMFLNGDWEEALQNSASFPEDDPEAFSLLIDWVHFNNVSTGISTSKVQLYLLAQKLCLTEVMDAVIDTIIVDFEGKNPLCSKWIISFSSEWIIRIYQETLDASPLRRYAIERLARAFQISSFESFNMNHNSAEGCLSYPDILWDFLRAVREIEGNSVKNPILIGTCLYHSHSKDETCYKNKGR